MFQFIITAAPDSYSFSSVEPLQPDSAVRCRSPRSKPAPVTVPQSEKKRQSRYTTIPTAWLGMELYHWRGRGFRTRNGVSKPNRNGRACKYWPFDHEPAIVRVPVGEPGLIRRIRALTGEIWPVFERRGRFWVRAFYFVPKLAALEAGGIMAGISTVRMPGWKERQAARSTTPLQSGIKFTPGLSDSADDFDWTAVRTGDVVDTPAGRMEVMGTGIMDRVEADELAAKCSGLVIADSPASWAVILEVFDTVDV